MTEINRINMFQDPFSEEIWRTTYKDHKDTCVQDTWRRIAKHIASAETTEAKRIEWEEKFYSMLENFRVVPGGRISANAGTEWKKTTFMNCYVGPMPEKDLDSIDGIYKVLVDQANTLKSEGGWGMDFSWIRPRGAFIEGIGVDSPGSVKFMELFDKSSEIVTAGSGKTSTNSKAKGKIRKGAQMATLSVTHPDIIEFITAKQTPGRLTKFNMSVNCTGEFMDKVNKVKELRELLSGKHIKEDEHLKDEYIAFLEKELEEANTWHLVFPDTTHEAYEAEWRGRLQDWNAKGYPVIIHNTVKVDWLWNLIMESTYNRAEPGVLWLDRANAFNPSSYHKPIHSTNPCGEQTLPEGECCNLGSINATQYVLPDRSGFDIEAIKRDAGYIVRFLDNVNTVSSAPLPQYKYSMEHKRRVGAGIMGWGSALFMLKVRFGSHRADELRDEITSVYARAAYEASIDLAEEKGMFSLCEPEKHAEGLFIKRLGLSPEYMQKLRTFGIRNSALLSNQPTGNGSILANLVTGGIEPAFMFEYNRTSICSTIPEEIAALTPNFNEGVFEETDLFKWVKEGDDDILKGTFNGVTYKIDRSRGLTKETLCEDYGVRYLKARGEWDPTADYAVTTTELSVNDHLKDLGGFARWVDSAISKTINIPHEYPFEDFKNVYLDAYNTGTIKGITTYRSGTLMTVLSAKDEATAAPEDEEIIVDDIKLPDTLPATLKTLRSEGRKWYLTTIMNTEQTKPVALFVQTNAHEKSITANDAVEKLLALARSKGIQEKHVADVEAKISGDNNASKICRCIGLCLRHGILIKNVVATLDKVDCIAGSFVFHIRKYLSTYILNGDKVQGEKCQECGSETIVYQEGCKICSSCGSSKCS